MFTNQTNPRIEPTAEAPIVGTVPIDELPELTPEAPDRGDDQAEPLEEALLRHAEAPDAGLCPADLLDQDYTHGRSMT